MQYIVIEEFVEGPRPVYERFAQEGRMLPAGLRFVASWVGDDLREAFQLMETDDPALLDEWMASWSDLVRFRAVPVVDSAEAASRVLGRRD